MIGKLSLLNPAGLRWSHVRDLLRFASRRLEEERLPLVAGSLTFTTTLALVPILTIALAIFTTFPLFDTFRKSLEAYFIKSLMPHGVASTILNYLNQFSAKASRLSVVGAVVLAFTAVAMLSMIDRVFNHIWRVKERRPFVQRILVYWAVMTLGPLLIGVSITVTSYLFTATSGVVMKVPFIGGVFYTLISVLLTTAAFTLLYMAVPNRFVDWRDAAWGGLVAAIGFEIAKRLFAVFIAKFPTYTVIYGALAAIPIFLIWIYLSWLITLMGAVIAAALPVIKYERWWHVATPATDFDDAMSVLQVLYHARESQRTAAVNGGLLRHETRIGFDESEILLRRMQEAGWVGCVGTSRPRRAQWGKRMVDGMDGWVLLTNPAHLTLADVYRTFVFDSAGSTALSRQVEAAIECGLGQTLAAYFDTVALGLNGNLSERSLASEHLPVQHPVCNE